MSTGITAPRRQDQASTVLPAGGVPWLTVLPLAVVLAFADGFWVESLRGAVGAIERTQSPFASWVRESALSVPLFVLAVLGALTLSMHAFGPYGHRPRQVLLSALLVTSAATAAGVAVLAASSVYDYRLQLQQDRMMGTMRQTCTGPCLVAQDEAAFWLQARSVGWGALILLATNAVLVAWAVAALGGRLRLSTPRTPRTPGAGRTDQPRTVLVVGLVCSAAIHAAVLAEHGAEWAAAGTFFLLLTVAELGAAGWLLVRARPSALLAAAAVSAGPLLLWSWSRTSGLPFGPDPGVPEAVGLADGAACLLEVVTLALALALLSGWRRVRRPGAASSHGSRLALVALVAVTAVGLAGTPLAWFSVLVDSTGHPG